MVPFKELQANSSRESVKRFPRKGWHLERGIIDIDAAQEIQTFLASRYQHVRDLFQDGSGGNKSGGASEDLQHFLIGEFDLETRLDRRIMKLVRSAEIQKFLCRFFKTNSYLVHYPPMIRFKKPGARGSVVPVHHDIAYNSHMTDFITVWVPLTDIDDACGGLNVYEGSQRLEHVVHESSGPWKNKAVCDLSAFRERHVTMRVGDALLFPPTLLHQSAPHRSEQFRYSIDFRVFWGANESNKSFYDPITEVVTQVD